MFGFALDEQRVRHWVHPCPQEVNRQTPNAPPLRDEQVEELPAGDELEHDEDLGLGGEHLAQLDDVAVRACGGNGSSRRSMVEFDAAAPAFTYRRHHMYAPVLDDLHDGDLLLDLLPHVLLRDPLLVQHLCPKGFASAVVAATSRTLVLMTPRKSPSLNAP